MARVSSSGMIAVLACAVYFLFSSSYCLALLAYSFFAFVFVYKLLLVYHSPRLSLSVSHQLTSSPKLLVYLAQWQANI